jgi:hypothetical protein
LIGNLHGAENCNVIRCEIYPQPGVEAPRRKLKSEPAHGAKWQRNGARRMTLAALIFENRGSIKASG